MLSHILKNGWNVEAVFCYDESKRRLYSDFTSFDEITKKYGIKMIKVKNINDKENVKILQEINPDLILVMGWSQLLNNEIIQIPRFGVIGSHPTELPKYRGRAPIPWTIIKGLKESALTFFYITSGIDDGDILDQRKFQISDSDDATSLYEKITEVGRQMLLDNLKLISEGRIKRIKQDGSKFIENWPKRIPEDGKIDWAKSNREIHTLIRATTHPYPGAFTFFKKHKLKIWKAKSLDEENADIGKIYEINNEGVKVGTGKGAILIKNASIDEGEESLAARIFTQNDVGELLN
jgi:methionyl-tRNA formyltransferase